MQSTKKCRLVWIASYLPTLWRSALVCCCFAIWVVKIHVARAENVAADVVTSAKISRCSDDDMPDAPARAFRRKDGYVVLVSANYSNYSLSGTSLLNLKKNCRSIAISVKDADPRKFSYLTWIASTWTNDGQHVAALAHEEFHGNEIVGGCQKKSLRACWYNSVVLLKSENGGQNFVRADDKLATPVFAPDFTNRDAEGEPRGYFNPTNMIRSGGYIYVIVGFNGLEKTQHGLCLARAQNPFDINSWELYQDSGTYVRSAGNPFRSDSVPPSACHILSGLDGVVGSINQIAKSDWFVATIIRATADGSGEVDFAYSKDLIEWTDLQTAVKLPAYWSKNCPGGFRYNYPALLNPSSDNNFDTVANKSFLYLVRGFCELGPDRDLIRLPVLVTPPMAVMSK